MSINFRELHAKHIALFNKKRGTRRAAFGSDSPLDLLVEEAQSLLQELRSAGRVICDEYQRQRLGSYAAYWGDFIFEESGTYPNTDLDPVDEKLVESLHGYYGTYPKQRFTQPTCQFIKLNRSSKSPS